MKKLEYESCLVKKLESDRRLAGGWFFSVLEVTLIELEVQVELVFG